MAVYIVMEPPRGDAKSRAERAVFVRDGFSALAFLFSVPWLLLHRLWIEAGLVFAASVGAALFGSWLGAAPLATALSLAISACVGLEANRLRLDALSRRGWRDWGPVEAQTLEDAEARYAHALEDETPAPVLAEPPAPRVAGAAGQSDLFAVPGYR